MSMTAFPQAAAVAGDASRHTPTVATPSHIPYDHDRRERRRSYATTAAPRSRPRAGTVTSGRPARATARPSVAAPRSSSVNGAHRIPRKPVRITSMERKDLENLPVRPREDNSLDALAALLGTKGVADENLLNPLCNYNRPMERLSHVPAPSSRPRRPSFTEEARSWAVATVNAPLKRVKKFSDAARGRRPSRAAVPSHTAGRRGSLQPQTLVHASPRTNERTRRNRSTTPAPLGPRPRIHAPGVYDAAAEWAVVSRSAHGPVTSRASRRQGMVFEDSFDVRAVEPREQAYLQLEGWNVVSDYDHGAAMQSVRRHRAMRRQPSIGTVRTMGTVASGNLLNEFVTYTPGQVGFMGKFRAVKGLNKKIAGLFK